MIENINVEDFILQIVHAYTTMTIRQGIHKSTIIHILHTTVKDRAKIQIIFDSTWKNPSRVDNVLSDLRSLNKLHLFNDGFALVSSEPPDRWDETGTHISDLVFHYLVDFTPHLIVGDYWLTHMATNYACYVDDIKCHMVG